MSFDPHNNFADGILQTGSAVIGSTSGNTIILNTGESLNFTSGQNIVVSPADVGARSYNAEIMRITSINTGTDTLTVTRAQENTTARNDIASGYKVSAAITKKTLTDIESAAGGVSASDAIAYAIALG